MASIFISYTTNDEGTATRLYTALNEKGFDVWYAPSSISSGANFADEISAELSEDDLRKKIEELGASKVLILILSAASMRSKWVAKEVKYAINKDITVLPLKIDHAELTPEFDFILSDIQIANAYGLGREALENLFENLSALVPSTQQPTLRKKQEKLSYDRIGIFPLAQGDPYYVYGETLLTKLTGYHFYLAPPIDEVPLSAEQKAWVTAHIANPPQLFDMTWDEVFAHIPIPDLRERIAFSRKKVLRQFAEHENGCYFNNLKFGINCINPFERTEDLSERPILTLEMFTTDYYTHRVMKDVCKTLIAEENEFLCNQLDYTDLRYTRIFFTSLGINLLLTEDSLKPLRKLLLTSRSINAAETYSKHQYSVSVVEGVSNSDYDPFLCSVSLNAAAYRGMLEELGVGEHMVQTDKLFFYDFFVNKANLEMGLSCSIELKKNLSLKEDVLGCHGKDEQLEISDKSLAEIKNIRQYLFTNIDALLPQAVYTICSYLESTGDFVIDRYHKLIKKKQRFIMSKTGKNEICGDAIVETPDYIAVIDGATPKGERLWNGLPGDVFIAQRISRAIGSMDKDLTAEEAVQYINNAVSNAYTENHVSYQTLDNAEKLQASVIIYSVHRHEVWSFGDCLLRINQRDYTNYKALDVLMRDLRAFCIEYEMLQGTHRYNPDGEDKGRQQILPFLKKQTAFANTKYSFGYDVIDGGKIFPEHVSVYAVQTGDRVTMSTDGYPQLFDTLEASEHYLAKCLQDDPECIYELRSTKGIYHGNSSYDDRAYISFNIE